MHHGGKACAGVESAVETRSEAAGGEGEKQALTTPYEQWGCYGGCYGALGGSLGAPRLGIAQACRGLDALTSRSAQGRQESTGAERGASRSQQEPAGATSSSQGEPRGHSVFGSSCLVCLGLASSSILQHWQSSSVVAAMVRQACFLINVPAETHDAQPVPSHMLR